MRRVPASFRPNLILALLLATAGCPGPDSGAGPQFEDDFEEGLGKWDLGGAHKIRLVDSGDAAHGTVLELNPGGDNVHALIGESDGWTNYRLQGEVLFLEDEHNYLGFIYNLNRVGLRLDYGCIYIKGNGSYIRVNPHRDSLVSRILYEEFRTSLTGESAIVTGRWQRFMAEVVGSEVHFYVGNLDRPKLTFPFFEQTSGRVGFEPRIFGSGLWIDNIRVTPIDGFSYSGPPLPEGRNYTPERMLTKWEAAGPFRRPQEELEAGRFTGPWSSLEADGRGCTVTGRVLEYPSQKWYAYFRTGLESAGQRRVTIRASTTNDLELWLDGKPVGEMLALPFAWFDFLENPEHAGREIQLVLSEGHHQLLVRARGVGTEYSGDGFYMAVVDSGD